MDEQVEKFGSNRKLKRFHNKQQRTQIKNYLNAVREAPEIYKEDNSDIEDNRFDFY